MKFLILMITAILTLCLSSCCTSNIHGILEEKQRLHPEIASNYHFIDTVLKHPAVLYKMRYDTSVSRSGGIMSYRPTKYIDKLTYKIEQFSKECILISHDTLGHSHYSSFPVVKGYNYHQVDLIADDKLFMFTFYKVYGLWKSADIQIYQYPMRTMGEMLHGKHPDMKP